MTVVARQSKYSGLDVLSDLLHMGRERVFMQRKAAALLLLSVILS